MGAVEVLSPIFIGLCLNNFVGKQGTVCNVRQTSPSVIKYYEPGKSCYVNGTFYSKCEDRLNGSK